jgi:CDP-diacylglycerol--inositol 3-phosphatidyltransferase
LQGKTSHKFIDLSENPIMRVYYTSKPILFFMCAGNEAFYAALYLLHFTEGPIGMFIITGNRNPL